MAKLISVKRASEITGYSVDYVRKLLREDKVKGKKFIANWKVYEESIVEYAVDHGELDGYASQVGVGEGS
jgi:hypothetical protein